LTGLEKSAIRDVVIPEPPPGTEPLNGAGKERHMADTLAANHPLVRLFTGLTEHAFLATVGIGDPKITGYIANLLVRFVHVDMIYRLRSATGARLEQVAEMGAEATVPDRTTRSAREYHRHIGDFTLFWTGVYPESLRVLRAPLRKDHLLDYRSEGKRAYWIASQYDDEPYREEAPVLRQLSEHFEQCAEALRRVRSEWERSSV
jgi:hypothetical protein